MTAGDATPASFLYARVWKKIRMTRHYPSLADRAGAIHREVTLSRRTPRLLPSLDRVGCSTPASIADEISQVIESPCESMGLQNREPALIGFSFALALPAIAPEMHS